MVEEGPGKNFEHVEFFAKQFRESFSFVRLQIANRDFGCIITQSSTRNFSYADQPDVCDAPAVAGEPPAGGSFVAARDEGE